MDDEEEEWLSASEAAEYTGVSTTTLRNWHRHGEIRSSVGSAGMHGPPFSGQHRGRRGLCFRRADLEELHAAWERRRPAREHAQMVRVLEGRATAAYRRWEAHAMRCPRRRRCPLAYVALWGWENLPEGPDPDDPDDPDEQRPDLEEAFDDVPDVAYRVMCGVGRRLYQAWLDARHTADQAMRAGQ